MDQKPDNQAISTQLDRLLKADALKSSPRTRRLLAHLVEKTQNGEENQLQGYAIGLDVFDRPETFDPQTDSIVRVQAGRLRKFLSAYYAGEGKEDPVIIDLPKGSYVPTFVTRPVENRRHRKDYTAYAGSFIGVCLLLLVVLFPPGISTNDFEHVLQLQAGPSVTVLPFEIVDATDGQSGQIDEALSSEGFRMLVTEKLSRFSRLRVVFATDVSVSSPQQTAKELGVDYYLTGTGRVDDNRLKLTVILAATADSTVVMSRSFDEEIASAANLFDLEAEIALGIAASLGRSDSGLGRDFIERASSLTHVEVEHYICLLEFFDYIDRKTEDEHLRIRTCLETCTAEHPDFAPGWAALSWIYGDERRNGYNIVEEDGAIRALAAAQRAVQADPENAMAYQYLSIAHFSLGNDAGFRRATDMALRLNPNDPDILADAGSLQIQVDNSEQGARLVLKAMELNPNHPPWYHGSLAMYYYLRDDIESALHHAERYRLEETIISQAVYTAALVKAGRLEEATKVYEDLVEAHPRFEDNKLEIVRTWRLPPGMDEELLAALATVGPNS